MSTHLQGFQSFSRFFASFYNGRTSHHEDEGGVAISDLYFSVASAGDDHFPQRHH